MARQFKPLRFFVLAAIVVFLGSAVTSFYTHRAAYGRNADERNGYVIGEKAGSETTSNASLPNPAELNMTAQRYYKRVGSGNQQDWDLGFENGYIAGFSKTHRK